MKGAGRENQAPGGVEKSMLNFNPNKIGNVPEALEKTVRSYRFALAAFLIPLFIRSIPEILVGPYPIGWDTIAFYVPNTLDWAAGKAGFTEILGTAPLMYMISVPVYWTSRVNPVWIFKIMGPILYGTMIWALFRFLKIGLKWPEKRALGGAMLTSLYFVTLRISWDLYRNMLGLTFILLSLPLLEDWKAPRKQALLTTLVVLAVASDQLTGVIALVLVGIRALQGLAKSRKNQFIALSRVALPGVMLFFSIVYAGLLLTGVRLLGAQPSVPTIESLGSSFGFLTYEYLALIPFVLFGLRSVRNLDVRVWSTFCVLIVATALVPSSGPLVMSYRWSLLLDLPLCVFAAAGLIEIAKLAPSIFGKLKVLQGHLVHFSSMVLILTAAAYIALPAGHAWSYYTAFPGFLPTSMVQDTVPMSDLGNLRALLNSAASQIGPGTVLITHQAIYGWVRAYNPALSGSVINYEYNSPLTGVDLARSEGYSSVLMIWWINGLGWHGQPNVPSGFTILVQNGNMALYKYQ